MPEKNPSSENALHPELPESKLKTARPAQRRTGGSHRKVAMKKLSLAALLVFVFLVLGSVTGVSAAAEKLAGRFANKLVFLVNVAQLYTKDPDRKLAMPVQDVEKSAVANT